MLYSLNRKAKEDKLAKRRFVGLLASERKTPGRKRKLAATDDVVDEPNANNSRSNSGGPAASLTAGSSLNSNSNSSSMLAAMHSQTNSNNANDLDDVVLIVEDPTSSNASLLKAECDPLALSNDDLLACGADLPAAGGEQTPSSLKSVVKERKRRIRIDDDDESPTFNPLGRATGLGRARGRGRGGRGGSRGGLSRQSAAGVQRTVKGVPVDSGIVDGAFRLVTPDKSTTTDNGTVVFMSPDEKMFTSPPEGKVSQLVWLRLLCVHTFGSSV